MYYYHKTKRRERKYPLSFLLSKNIRKGGMICELCRAYKR
nr:MAG TPA: hypothetical protein [Caudoviricetes sp.]DAS82452.1 MAG TPA: hypothetical protein [Caudoviricetes sp.]